LVELAELQDREVGDGTTSVVIVAAELLKVNFHLFFFFTFSFSFYAFIYFWCLCRELMILLGIRFIQPQLSVDIE
jgi:uncharacterized protein (DUF983 family)